MPARPDNAFTRDPIARTFIRTALPIIALTSVNGLLTVVDAIFLGAFVGPDALTAVTIVFPLSMLLVALATMVSSGMASVLGRQLGAGDIAAARRTFGGAHGLSLVIGLVMIALFVGLGRPVVAALAGEAPHLAAMGWTFLAVSIVTAPLLFLLSVQSDGLRTEGRIGFMAVAGLLVSLANMAFNYGLIVWFGLGIAGSALGTALAQACALLAIAIYRARGRAVLPLSLRDLAHWRSGWGEVLALGAPRSLAFIGIALGATATIVSLRLHGSAGTDATIAAYGVVTRMMTFAFFPLLGMALALQAIVGNNFGAGLMSRSNAALRLALGLALAYGVVVEALLIVFRDALGGFFVDDPAVSAEVARILPVFVALYFTTGPMMMIANYFQSIGDITRSALLSLARTYLFAVPLTFLLPLVLGETGIWAALPLADLLLVLTTLIVLSRQSPRLRWGLFQPA